MKEMQLDFHDEESSFDLEIEGECQTLENVFDDSEEEMEMQKELIFLRRLDDF